MNNKRPMRQKRSVTGTTGEKLTPVTDYNPKVEDPHSNCCNNDYSREEFRKGVRQVKMKKFRHHLNAIKPRTPNNDINKTTIKKTETTFKIPRNEKMVELRKRRDLSEMYPSRVESGESHQLGRFGIGDEDHTVTKPPTTRWPTTPKFLNVPSHRTKSNLIRDVEKRYSLDINNLTTPFTFKWSPYGLVITNSVDLDSDSELEVMDWYEERESPTYTTIPTTVRYEQQTEITMYDYDGMTNFNIENVKKIEKKFNVSMKDFENHPDNMRIRAKTMGFGFHGLRDRMKNLSSAETIIDKFEPDLTPIFPRDPGFEGPDGKRLEYGERDWVLKDLLAKWRVQENGSFETLHRRAENFTLEEKKKECIRLGIPWTRPTAPIHLLTTTLKHDMTTTLKNENKTDYARDEQVMENHYKQVQEVIAYHKKHNLIPNRETEEPLNPESEECQNTIMDWICRGWTDSHQEHEHFVTNTPPKRKRREIKTEKNTAGVITAEDCYRTFHDPKDFAEALMEIQDENTTIIGHKKFQEGNEGKIRETNNLNIITTNIPKRMKREMPYLGYSGLSSRIVFQWTDFPYDKTKAPFFVRRDKIRLKHRPTDQYGIPIFIRRKAWTFYTTTEFPGQSLKWVDGIPVRESLDYGMTVRQTTTQPPMSREVDEHFRRQRREVTDMEDYENEKDVDPEPEPGSNSNVNSGDLNDNKGKSIKTITPSETNKTKTSIDVDGNVATVPSRLFYSKRLLKSNEISKRIKRDLWTGFEAMRKGTRGKSENIKNIERRFRVDIDKITTVEPFNMTLLLEIMSKIVFTYADTEAPTTTEPPKPSVVKFRTKYSRVKRDHDRFMEYIADPYIVTVDAPHMESSSNKVSEKRSQFRDTPEGKDQQLTENPLKSNHMQRDLGRNFSYIMDLEPLINTVDRFKRYVDDKVKLEPTESWLNRVKREMPYLGYSGLSSRIVFQWTDFPYDKTKAPFFVRRDKIRLKHRPTDQYGIPIFIRRKAWTFYTTTEFPGQSLKWVDGIPVRESLDYGMTVRQTTTQPPMSREVDEHFRRQRREVGNVNSNNTQTDTNKTSTGTDSTTISASNAATSRAASSSNVTHAAVSTNSITATASVAERPVAIGENMTIVNGTFVVSNLHVNGTSSTPSPADTDFATPISNVINPVQTLGRKKRAAPRARRMGKDLFERIIQVYFNCKNVWKEPHSPEILQIRRRYREQKNRPLDRILGRRHHNHVDIYYDT